LTLLLKSLSILFKCNLYGLVIITKQGKMSHPILLFVSNMLSMKVDTKPSIAIMAISV